MRIPQIKAWTFVLMLVLLAINVQATTYYINWTGGSDSNSGLSASAPFKSINKSNNMSLVPGDSILFARGETWRMTTDAFINFRSGNSSGYVTYGAYGTGSKPVFLSSYNISSPLNWTNQTATVWVTNKTYTSTIGNLVYNDEASIGVNHYYKADMTDQGDFMYNATNDY